MCHVSSIAEGTFCHLKTSDTKSLDTSQSIGNPLAVLTYELMQLWSSFGRYILTVPLSGYCFIAPKAINCCPSSEWQSIGRFLQFTNKVIAPADFGPHIDAPSFVPYSVPITGQTSTSRPATQFPREFFQVHTISMLFNLQHNKGRPVAQIWNEHHSDGATGYSFQRHTKYDDVRHF